MRYRNPVLPGFYPDPSVCRVGEDYYLVSSSFNYFPGVPLFHSRDLVHWRQLGHCLTRPSQLSLSQATTRTGIYAATIRHHAGRFYIITTNFDGGGNFFVWTDDIHGEWSEPVWIPVPCGFDPDLFFDADNGTAFYSQHNFPGPFISQWRIDLATGQPVSEEVVIWRGHEDELCEAPHIYKIGEYYYLIVAEGGTYRGHMVVAARAKHPTGPFEPCPHNPILTHRCIQMARIQCLGHADIVQAPNGTWWLLCLGVRYFDWFHFHNLGRETFLAPLAWDADGWPVVNGGRPMQFEMEAHGLEPSPWPAEAPRDDFDALVKRHCWVHLRNPINSNYSLCDRPGWLRLDGSALTLTDPGSPTLLLRRQCHVHCAATTLLDFTPRDERDEAGLTVFMDDQHHYELAVTVRTGRRVVLARRRIGDLTAVIAERVLLDGPVMLGIEADETNYRLWVSPPVPKQDPQQLAVGLTRYLSTEVATGFTGVFFGLYATGNGQPCGAPAWFDWFDYTARD